MKIIEFVIFDLILLKFEQFIFYINVKLESWENHKSLTRKTARIIKKLEQIKDYHRG